ncbi:MAG: efflux RND transporter permease subunit [Bacteroidales bacterium]
MRHISELVFKQKTVFYFLLVCIIAGGIMSYMSLSKLEDPEIIIMQASVITVYPGASAHEVEMQVTNVLEEEINTLADLESIKSTSSANVSRIDVELEMTVPQNEIPQRWEFLRRKVYNAAARLPKEAQAPIVLDDIGDVYGMFYAMTADGFSYQEMGEMADYIRREMLEVEGVRKVHIYGAQKPCIDVVLPVEKMANLGVLPLQVIMAIQGQNAVVYPGAMHTGDLQLRVTVDDRLNSEDDLKNLLVKSLNGEVFKLSDIASIERGYNEPMRNTMFVNNKPAIGISLSMESGENIISLGKKVDEKMKLLQKNVPVGYDFTKVFFQPDVVKKAINGFMLNLTESVILVIIILMITMGLRSGIIIGTGLIITILATFPILLSTGGTLQRISLGAFIVAMGMLVDNAIVVVDGILVDLQTKGRRKSTFVNTPRRTAIPLLSATVIAVLAFFPVFLSKDTAGTYARDLFIVLCISLIISWLLALTQVPLFSASFLKVSNRFAGKKPYDGKIYMAIEKALSFFMEHKVTTVVISTILLGVAAYNFKNVKQSFFPDFNYNQVYIEYKLPEGTAPGKVKEDLEKITARFLTFPQVKMVVSSHGSTPARYSLVRAIGEADDSYGELIVNFEDYSMMIEMKPVLEAYLHNNYPDAYCRIRKYNLSIKSTHLVEVEFSGPDPAVLRSLSRKAEEIMYNSEYTDKYTVSSDWHPMGKALYVRYNQAAARRAGTTRQDVSIAILAATDGLPVARIYEGETEISVNLKTRNSDGSAIKDIGTIPVWSMIPDVGSLDKEKVMGMVYGTESFDDVLKEVISPVPLSALSEALEIDSDEKVVKRVNGKRAIQAQCDPLDGYSPALLRKTIRKQVESIPLPNGYAFKWMGEYELQGSALKNIFRFLPIAIALIILVLILLFNDLRRPAIVILCIPMAIIGIVPGLILLGMPFTFMAIIGTVGLIGMLIKNSIVLLDEIEVKMHEGHDHYNAIIYATVSRTRPVLMASLTTILGMAPLLLDPMYQSMAAAVISGLLVGTIITLIFVPILYAVFHNVHKGR